MWVKVAYVKGEDKCISNKWHCKKWTSLCKYQTTSVTFVCVSLWSMLFVSVRLLDVFLTLSSPSTNWIHDRHLSPKACVHNVWRCWATSVVILKPTNRCWMQACKTHLGGSVLEVQVSALNGNYASSHVTVNKDQHQHICYKHTRTAPEFLCWEGKLECLLASLKVKMNCGVVHWLKSYLVLFLWCLFGFLAVLCLRKGEMLECVPVFWRKKVIP